MLHDRILLLVRYVTEVIAGSAQVDHAALRSLSALVASLPASDHPGFRKEFEQARRKLYIVNALEYEDVQLTAYLSQLTKSTNILNDLVDKHIVFTASRENHAPSMPGRRHGRFGGGGRMGMGMGSGMFAIWVTFIGGFIALKALPRQMFGTLQHSTFPIYFKLSMLLTGGLVALWSYGHPGVMQHLSEPARVDVAQVYTLGSAILAQGANQFVVGPLTSK
ncbi:hypothetical protein EIP86_000143 [Pleurotus ostreatoroseus]|nr:hypothetical protein EIP86_000143 [Pleurotus ostreatoroseus]